MSQATSQWWTEFSFAAPIPLGFDMDSARATFISSTTGTFVDTASEPLGRTIGDDFLLGGLSEFANEDIAAPICSSETQFSSCQTSNSAVTLSEAVSSSNTPLEGDCSEKTNMLDNAYRPQYGDIMEFDWLSPLVEDALIFGGSNFYGDCFLIPGVYGNDQASCEENRPNTGSFVDPFTFTPEIAPVPGRARSKRSRCGARVWSSGEVGRGSNFAKSLESNYTGVSDTTAGAAEILKTHATPNLKTYTTPNLKTHTTPKLKGCGTNQAPSAGNQASSAGNQAASAANYVGNSGYPAASAVNYGGRAGNQSDAAANHTAKAENQSASAGMNQAVSLGNQAESGQDRTVTAAIQKARAQNHTVRVTAEDQKAGAEDQTAITIADYAAIAANHTSTATKHGSIARNHVATAANPTASAGNDSKSAEAQTAAANRTASAENDTERAEAQKASANYASRAENHSEDVQDQAAAARGGGRLKWKEEGGRRCRHCLTQKTPQWRAGPEGLKTLCNACGVRLKKKGRLFPEYRPVRSPTFSILHHSNSHTRVLEMRRLKETSPHTPTHPISTATHTHCPSSPTHQAFLR